MSVTNDSSLSFRTWPPAFQLWDHPSSSSPHSYVFLEFQFLWRLWVFRIRNVFFSFFFVFLSPSVSFLFLSLYLKLYLSLCFYLSFPLFLSFSFFYLHLSREFIGQQCLESKQFFTSNIISCRYVDRLIHSSLFIIFNYGEISKVGITH